MPRRAAVGFSIHTGWAAAVVLAGPPPKVLARRRIELAADEHDARFVFHAAAENPNHAQRMIEQAESTARRFAAAALKSLMVELEEYTLLVALPRARQALPPLPTVLKSHPLLHAAEGALFRRAIAEAAEALGLATQAPAAGDPPILGKMRPPWGKDQKTAAALAWASLTLFV